MRFSQKIFIMTFILIIVSMNVVGFMVIRNNHKINVDAEINRNIIQINNISNNLYLYNSIEILSTLANQYLRNNTHMEIYKEDNMIYTNLIDTYTEIKLNILSQTEEISVCIEEIEGTQVLFMALKEDPYKIITATEVSNIYKIREEQISFFTKVSITCSLIIALILYLFCYILTKRINKLNKAVSRISKGEYKVQVSNMGNDEIGNLGKVFNQMSDSVSKNVEEINKISESRQNFINNITHEIRTPLTSIIGFSSLIKNEKVTQKEAIIEYANKIYDEGNYINEISDKLMDIIMLDNNKQEFEIINISEVIENICLNFKDVFNNISIDTDIYKDVYIKADGALIKSLIINLIKNSSEAYENNKAIVRVELSKDCIIKVIDYGKGISEEDIEKIKSPFYTLNKSRNRKKSGMGLGIPLCIKIIEVHNGTFEINSKLGEGTEVIINLAGGKINE